jgi:hypothetical protein
MTVTISERSWHLRYVRAVDEALWRMCDLVSKSQNPQPYVPKHLCAYFWRVVLCVPVNLWLAMVLVLPLLLLKWTFLVLWWIVSGAYRVVRTGVQRLRPRRVPRVAARETQHPSLFVAYLKASRERLCPLIEVVKEP